MGSKKNKSGRKKGDTLLTKTIVIREMGQTISKGKEFSLKGRNKQG